MKTVLEGRKERGCVWKGERMIDKEGDEERKQPIIFFSFKLSFSMMLLLKPILSSKQGST